MLAIGSEVRKSNRFELVVQVRDGEGSPTGRTKHFVTDNPEELEVLWNRNSSKVNKKKKKVAAAAKEYQVAEALKEANAHIEKIRKARKLEE